MKMSLGGNMEQNVPYYHHSISPGFTSPHIIPSVPEVNKVSKIKDARL